MSWDKKMDYIYKNKDEVKCVGTIRSIETFAYYSFDIVIDNRSEWCRLIENELDWEICFVMRDMTIGLAHPNGYILEYRGNIRGVRRFRYKS